MIEEVRTYKTLRMTHHKNPLLHELPPTLQFKLSIMRTSIYCAYLKRKLGWPRGSPPRYKDIIRGTFGPGLFRGWDFGGGTFGSRDTADI